MNTKVLIVEPDRFFKENLIELLTLEGFMAKGVSNTGEAKKIIGKFCPSIIICDEASLTGGFDKFQKDLKKDLTAPSFFIMVIDGTDEEFKVADAYIKMPFRNEELLSKLQLLSQPAEA